MQSYQKEIQTKLLKYGSLKEVIRKIGIIAFIDFTISNFLNLISRRIYRSNSINYGIFEALFYSRGIDRWRRNIYVANEIQKMKMKATVLEVGSGGQGISGFLNPKRTDLVFFLFDVRKDVFKGLKGEHCVIGDGCRLPFRDKAFDIIVSVDAVEHIPKSIRNNFYKEAKRVAGKKIILACPLQSGDGEFQGRKYDIIFQSIHEKNHGTKELNTEQHIKAFHPTLEEISGVFPGSIICGYKNADIWLKYMVIQSKPIIGLFCGILYYLFWKKNDDKPPYWGAIIISNPEKYSVHN